MTTTLVWPLLLTLLLIVPMVLLLDVWLVRLAWQTANRDLRRDDDLPPQKEPPPFRAAAGANQNWIVLLVVFAVIGLLLLATILGCAVLGYWVMPISSKPAPPRVAEPAVRYSETEPPILEQPRTGKSESTVKEEFLTRPIPTEPERPE